MPDSYYYWFDTTDKGVQSPKVRPINKKNVEEVIEEYIIHVKDDEELDKVPKLIKNVEKYTTTWGGKWDKEKQERFQGWVKDSYDSIMKKELRSLADDHLQDWGDFYDGLHLSEDTTTVEDLQSLADIREFAGYQFAPPESDLGESQRELSLQRKTMKWKEFLDERSISDLSVSNTKKGATTVIFSINHSDGKIQKEIFRKAFPNAQINTKKNPASHGKSIADYSNVIQSESVGGKSLPAKGDKEKDTKKRNNKIERGLDNIFAIENIEDEEIWQDIFISDVKQLEVKKPKSSKSKRVDRDKTYNYELKTDEELKELFKPKKGKEWELEDEEGKEIEYPEQVDFEEPQEEFEQRVLIELTKIKKLPRNIEVKRVKGLTDQMEYQTTDGKKISSEEIKYYKPVKTDSVEEEPKQYQPQEYNKSKLASYLRTAVTKTLPKDVLSEEPAYVEIQSKDSEIYITDDTIDKVYPMIESWVKSKFNAEYIRPAITEIIQALPEVLTSREKKLKQLTDKLAESQGSPLSETQLIHVEKYLLDSDDELKGFKESEIKKHSVTVSGELANNFIGSLTQGLSARREMIGKLITSKAFYQYLKRIGLNMNPWYLSDYKFELLFDPTVILENMAKHKVLTFVPVIEEIPKLMISRKALIATQGKKSGFVTPEISSPARGGNPASAAMEYTQKQVPADLKAKWEQREKDARALDKEGRTKALEEIGKEKRQWKTQNIKGFNEAKEFWGQRISSRKKRLIKLAPYIREGTE